MALMVLGVIICIITPHMRYLRVFTRYTVLLLLIYFLVAMAFLMLRQQRLLFTALGCCAALCVFLKSSGGPGLKRPKLTKDPMVTVAHFNMSSGQEDYKSAIATILHTNADVISLQELTPDWFAIIRDSLSAIYPYSCVSIGSDMYGLGLFSQKKIIDCDTFYCNEIPNLDIALELSQNKKIHIISSYVSPPLWSGAYALVNQQLKSIAQHTKKIKSPVITLGDYNIEPWSREIREFKAAAGVADSRLWYTADTPLNHIYYSKQLDCVGFDNIMSASAQQLGIIGTYQLQQAKIKN
jgi:endonuclease/exonuclease/phosphatase (EEP) superfamily protein YafD